MAWDRFLYHELPCLAAWVLFWLLVAAALGLCQFSEWRRR